MSSISFKEKILLNKLKSGVFAKVERSSPKVGELIEERKRETDNLGRMGRWSWSVKITTRRVAKSFL